MPRLYFIDQTSSTATHGGMTFMHAHELYELYFLLDGQKTYITSSTLINIQKNTLVITAPTVVHKFENGPYRRILIQLPPNELSPAQRDFFDHLAKKDVLTFDDKSMSKVKKVLEQMLEVFNTPNKHSKTLFFILLGKLIDLIYRHGQQSQSSFKLGADREPLAVTPTIMKVLDYVNNHYVQKISLDQLAKEFNISKAWLTKCFKLVTDMPVMEYKLSLQLNKAKNLLVTTNKSIDQICKECGFSSPNYFGLIFKKHMGLSPTKYCSRRGQNLARDKEY